MWQFIFTHISWCWNHQWNRSWSFYLTSNKSHTDQHNKGSGKVPGVNLFWLSQKLVTEQDSLNYCQELRLIAKTVKCPTCRHDFNKYAEYKNIIEDVRCTDFNAASANVVVKCNHIPVRKGTWLEESKLSLRKNLLVIYYFVQSYLTTSTILTLHETSVTSAESDNNSSVEVDSKVVITSKETSLDHCA